MDRPQGLPVTLETPCPEPPGYALAATRMRRVPYESAVRLPASPPPTTRDIVLGYIGAGVDLYQTGSHLAAGWLSDRLVNSATDRYKAWAIQLLRNLRLFRSQVHASTMVPVGRLKKGGGDPAFLYVMFPTMV